MKPKTNTAPTRKPNLKFKLDSILIESNHIPLFSSWIDKKDSLHYNNKNNPYEFKLLHRSSRDGFSPAKFHKNCDGKGATIWVTKVQGSTQLVGIYNPLDWGGYSSWKETADSFLFNFIDGKNIHTAELSYSNNTETSVFCHNTYGPHTGDLKYSSNNTWHYNHNGSYSKIDIPTEFTVEDYEVFQIVKQ
jgi:hypothetical protein